MIGLVLKLMSFLGGPWIKVAFGFMGKHWKIILIALVIAGMAWKFYSLSSENKDLRADVAVAEQTIKSHIVANAQLNARIDSQNKAVLERKAKAEAHIKRLESSLKRAKRVIDRHDRNLIALSQSNPNDNSCESTIVWMIERKDDLKWVNPKPTEGE